MGTLGASSIQSAHRSSNSSSPAVAKPSALIMNSSPVAKDGTPGTSSAVNFRAFGSPVMKNDAIAPIGLDISNNQKRGAGGKEKKEMQA